MVILILHWVFVFIWFCIAGAYTGKSPIQLIKNQIPGYLTAAATQSSAATIPVNLSIAEKNGVSEKIRNFVIPFWPAHILGSVMTIVSIIYAVLLLNGIPTGLDMFIPFIFTLGIAMVAAPGHQVVVL